MKPLSTLTGESCLVREQKANSCYLGQRPVQVGQDCFGVDILWIYCVQLPGVAGEILARFPLSDPTEMLNIPTSLSPLDLWSGFRLCSMRSGIPWRHVRLGQFGCQGNQTTGLWASRPTSTRTAHLCCLNPGTFQKSHLKRDQTHTESLSGKVGKDSALDINEINGHQLLPLLSISQLLPLWLKSFIERTIHIPYKWSIWVV